MAPILTQLLAQRGQLPFDHLLKGKGRLRVITGCSGHRWRRSVVGARAEVDGHVLRTWCRLRSHMGLFAKPTAPMKTEAASSGVLDTPFGKFARLQILTIEDLFSGKRQAMAPEDPAAFRKAAHEEDETRQGKLI